MPTEQCAAMRALRNAATRHFQQPKNTEYFGRVLKSNVSRILPQHLPCCFSKGNIFHGLMRLQAKNCANISP